MAQVVSSVRPAECILYKQAFVKPEVLMTRQHAVAKMGTHSFKAIVLSTHAAQDTTEVAPLAHCARSVIHSQLWQTPALVRRQPIHQRALATQDTLGLEQAARLARSATHMPL